MQLINLASLFAIGRTMAHLKQVGFCAGTLVLLLAMPAGAQSTIPVYEFYHTTLDHYFRTSDAGEATGIDNGAAGPGWVRTGDNFLAYPANSFPAGAAPVCRFYGSVNPGPNSHFYTSDKAECDGLKALQASTPATQKRWNYEGLAFAIVPGTGNTCASGLKPVYRLYNNGHARGEDSNHRYTTLPTEYTRLQTGIWKGEGVVMCAASQGGTLPVNPPPPANPQPPPPTIASPYAGTWSFFTTLTTRSSTCDDGNEILGVEQHEFDFTVDSLGKFTLEQGFMLGTINSDGTVTISVGADIPVVCPGGTLTGTMISLNSGSGTISIDGRQGTWRIQRSSPAVSPYAGTWNLFSTMTVAGCGDSPSDVGKEQKQVITVDNSGNFTLEQGLILGRINSNGTVVINVPADACPGGTITGTMTSLNSGSGTYSIAGSQGTFRLQRL